MDKATDIGSNGSAGGPQLADAPAHPQRLAFVLRLHRASDAATHRLCGRVEHLASGRRLDFAAMSELQAWLEQVLGLESGAVMPVEHRNLLENPT